jgi:hypothetical protein
MSAPQPPHQLPGPGPHTGPLENNTNFVSGSTAAASQAFHFGVDDHVSCRHLYNPWLLGGMYGVRLHAVRNR